MGAARPVLMVQVPNGLISEDLHASRAEQQIAEFAALTRHHGHGATWQVVVTADRIPRWPG